MSYRWIIGVALLVGCGTREEPPPPQEQPSGARPVSKANAHGDAADAKALPAAGMVCRGDRSSVWTEDGAIAPLRAIRPALGRDGQVYETYESVHALQPGGKPVKYPVAGKTPRVVITSSASMLVQSADQRVDVYRDGTWTSFALTVGGPDVPAVEHANAWWLGDGDRVVRVAGTTLETAATLEGPVHALAEVGGALWVASTPRGTPLLTFAPHGPRDDGSPSTTFSDAVTGPAQVAQGADRAAVLLPTRATSGVVYLLEPARPPARIAEEVQALGGFDGAQRLWYRTQAALVAREPDGALTLYPFANEPRFGGRAGALCVPFGGGFATLPPAR